ncbi:MAG: phosphoribosylformylglycinamidine synthase subunit PurL [bacterium]
MTEFCSLHFMNDSPTVTVELALQHGLSTKEYQRILNILGRTPTYEELGVFSAMWSEHCSYKNSILELRKLPRSGGRLLAAAGEENAGLVDIGYGLAVAFKIESHNHPCAVEPYQGAATGMGGILRDVFSLGARPIALLDSLHFGRLEQPRNCFLMDQVVRGVGDYGNCTGVPTVGGEVFFHEGYSANPIVNCLAVGIVNKERIQTAAARGTGNPVILYGSSTGRDGIHGATFASEEISAASESRRSSVQVGDPFTEKLLIEATLELTAAGVLIGVQDLGAAGITCAVSETAARGGVGMEFYLDQAPLREKGMTPYEILLSESQERMLAILQAGCEEQAEAIIEKWGLNSAIIGKVTDGNRVKVFYQNRTVCDIPAQELVLGGGAPVYRRNSRRPRYLDELNAADLDPYRQKRDWNETLLKMLASPNICDKSWVYEQYDSTVGASTILGPGGDAALLWIRATPLALAICTDGNPRYVYLNPRRGAALAVAEAARNVSCTGAKPTAITNCLNFGNPYKPESYYFFREAIAGMGKACRVLNTPVTGGNVSFYNESETSAILPTPVIGMLGILDDVTQAVGSFFNREGDAVILLGENKPDLGGSEFLAHLFGKLTGDAPELDLALEKRTQACLRTMIRRGWVRSAHDCSLGGLVIALAKCCLKDKQHPIGAQIHLHPGTLSITDLLFAESPSRILISSAPDHAAKILRYAGLKRVPAGLIGRTGGDRLMIGNWINVALEIVSDAYIQTLPGFFHTATTAG